MRTVFIAFWLWLLLFPSAQAADPVRLESDLKLAVPTALADDVWQWLQAEYPEACMVRGISLTCMQSIEEFQDTYFDTPQAQCADLGHGIRHRRRRLPDGTQTQLVQIKYSAFDRDDLREELKFEVRNGEKVQELYDDHPLLRLIRRRDRVAFWQELKDRDIDALKLRPVLDITQKRRRIYIGDDEPLLTITFDLQRSRKWWVEAELTEIEIEINELRYTNNPAERPWFEELQDDVRAGILEEFPEITQDQTPKYTKVFQLTIGKIPGGKMLLAWGLL